MVRLAQKVRLLIGIGPLNGGVRGMGRAPGGFMDDYILAGGSRDIGGKIKETTGEVVGSPGLQAEGIGDQIAGKALKVSGHVRAAVSEGVGPLLARARDFARNRPFAAMAIAGVIGAALFGTARGRRFATATARGRR